MQGSYGAVARWRLPPVQVMAEVTEHQIAARRGGEVDRVRRLSSVILAIWPEAVDHRLAVLQAVGDGLIPKVDGNRGQPPPRDVGQPGWITAMLQVVHPHRQRDL